MKINIKKNLDLTPSLQTYIEQKFEPLTKFIKEFDETGEAEIWLEVARTTRHHQKGEEVFLAAADLRLPRKSIHAEEYADDVRKAIDQTRDVLRFEIEKYKKKLSEQRRGRGALQK